MLRRVSPVELRRVVIFALLTMALLTLPYALAYRAQGFSWKFTGFLFGVEDGNSYLAKMRQGALGAWQFHLTYTSEPHEGAYLFLPYLLLGKVAALFGDPNSADFYRTLLFTFHAARFLFGVLAILVTWRFLALFLPRGSMRWAALTLICFGGGLGWLLVIVGLGDWLGAPQPVDFYLPEGYMFYILYGLPHLCLARAMLLGGFILFFQGGWRRWLLAGVCWLVMGLCVPFYIAVLYVLLGVWGLVSIVRQRRFPVELFIKCVIAGVVPLPVLLYNFAVFVTNPIMGAWSNQNKLPSPHPLHYVFGFGVLYLLAIPAIRWAWRRGRHQPAYLLLIGWIVAAPILAYTPVSVQRRLLEGLYVPLCILAIAGLRYVVAPALRYRRRTAEKVYARGLAVVLFLCLPTTILILLGGLTLINNPAPPAFAPVDYGGIASGLRDAPRNSVVLSDYEIGNLIPAWTNHRVFIGHGPETIDGDRKRALWADFLQNGTLATLKTFPGDPIRYVIISNAQYLSNPLRWREFRVKPGGSDHVILELP
jgi:hypothetical protein